jgi:hypothetical protein
MVKYTTKAASSTLQSPSKDKVTINETENTAAKPTVAEDADTKSIHYIPPHIRFCPPQHRIAAMSTARSKIAVAAKKNATKPTIAEEADSKSAHYIPPHIRLSPPKYKVIDHECAER